MKRQIVRTNNASKPHLSKPFFNTTGEGGFFAQPKRNEGSFFLIQPKLTIGQPGDKYEQEADAMADKVINMKSMVGHNMPAVQAKCEACEEEGLQAKLKVQNEEGPLQTKPSIMRQPDGSFSASPGLTARLHQERGNGNPLPASMNAFMSARFNADFSHVKIHTSSTAVQMNQDIAARAFTYGSDIYFNQGEYRPGHAGGKHLLAHELTHVLQQQGKPIGPIEGPHL